MTSRVLVTGGSGFIGTWVLRELLDCGASPVVVDLQPARDRWNELLGNRAGDVVWSNASLLDRDSLLATIKDQDITRVIHLAALLTPDCQQRPWDGCRVNVLGSTAVFDAARLSESVQAIAYASSYAVYGDESAADISGWKSPTFYGAFKLSVDAIAAQYWQHFALSSVAIRPHVVYGPLREQGLTAGPSLAIKAAVEGNDFCIRYQGAVAYDYVEDAARAFVRAAFETTQGATIVDLPGERATTDEFANAIRIAVPESSSNISVDGPMIPPNVPTAPNYITSLFPDWTPTSLQDGVRRTADYYRRLRTSYE